MDFQIFHEYQHDGKLPPFEKIYRRALNHIKMRHGKYCEQVSNEPIKNKNGFLVRLSMMEYKHGSEFAWQIPDLDMVAHIQNIVKVEPACEVGPFEKQRENFVHAMHAWNIGDVESYVITWKDALEAELKECLSREEREFIYGKTLLDDEMKDGHIVVAVSSDFLLKCGWDQGDYVMVSVSKCDDNEPASAIIKNISFTEQKHDILMNCFLLLKVTGNLKTNLTKPNILVKLQKQGAVQIFQKWIQQLDFCRNTTITGAASCIILNKAPQLVRNDKEVGVSMELCSSESFQNLSVSQMKIIRAALGQELTILKGHPGTGKTAWICALLYALSKIPDVGKVLVTGATNAAINVVCSAFVSTYHPKCIARPCSYQVELPTDLEKFRMTQKKDSEALSNSQFVFCTCIHSLTDLVRNVDFQVVIVDEASQMIEPDLVCAIAGRNIQQIILVGDPLQNSPVSLTRNQNLMCSPMERLLHQGYPVETLKEQYRMLPQLADIPRQFSYSEYEDTIQAKCQEPLDIPYWRDHPCWFLQIPSAEFKDSSGSCFNYAACRNIAQLIDRFVTSGLLKGNQIGVIDSYKLDKIVLESVVKQYATKRAKHAKTSLNEMPHMQVTINTVDGFQGGQKDFIIWNTVRANSRNKIGFLRNIQRFNVATTRAKKGLLVVGDFSTFYNSKVDFWRKFLFDMATANPPRIINGVKELLNKISVNVSEMPLLQVEASVNKRKYEQRKTNVQQKRQNTNQYYSRPSDNNKFEVKPYGPNGIAENSLALDPSTKYFKHHYSPKIDHPFNYSYYDYASADNSGHQYASNVDSSTNYKPNQIAHDYPSSNCRYYGTSDDPCGREYSSRSNSPSNRSPYTSSGSQIQYSSSYNSPSVYRHYETSVEDPEQYSSHYRSDEFRHKYFSTLGFSSNYEYYGTPDDHQYYSIGDYRYEEQNFSDDTDFNIFKA